MYYFPIFFIFLSHLTKINGDSYSVKIGTDSHVNLIDPKFLSFTIDPKYLFSSSEKYRSKECICMASSLSPAYIRIAGPTTALLSFHNATITIDDETEEEPRVSFHDSFADDLSKEFKERKLGRGLEARFKRNHEKIEVSNKEWRKFIQWAKSTGFELVFALNHEERTSSGMWDPNTALNILTVAEKANIGDIYWQLGYECKNQSIEEYLNDLETLRVITETFPAGRAGRWRVAPGDVTSCLQEESKSDFKDYIMLADDMMDAILLDGKSSSQELARMSDRERYKLLKHLSRSTTPLWLADSPVSPASGSSPTSLHAAADWLISLGHAARNGFSHHFRELGDEMYQPTLSFYMALLFKNLVGSKVLDVETSPEQAALFAHCTSLRHAAVPGAVTLYAANVLAEPARYSVRVGAGGAGGGGGDVLQFVLAEDSSGNIQVNGRSMYFEGDLKPVVKRVRPYKTLVINLPAKSFGFWVLANTKVSACYDYEDNHSQEPVEILSGESTEEKVKIKRAVTNNDFDEHASLDFFNEEIIGSVTDKNIVKKMADLNDDLNKVQELFNKKQTKDHERTKRTIDEFINKRRSKLRRHGVALRNKKSNMEETPKGIIGNLIQRVKRNLTRNFKPEQRPVRFTKTKVNKRNPRARGQENKPYTPKMKRRERTTEKPLEVSENESRLRTRRSVENDIVKSKTVKLSSAENDVDDLPSDKVKLWKILRKIHKQLKDLSEESEYEDDEDKAITESETGLIKTTVGNLMGVLSDLNKNLQRFWNTINLLD